ncbi:MAG: hypothetical protein INF81_05375 [Roseomonas sp.]|nr:hypothetical protein [Roseomonas sp.]MCA3428875.1 hypothetical protein [Roseomonas sp.]MCA3434786.1 hypothetical protein [Roseomonas sp.]
MKRQVAVWQIHLIAGVVGLTFTMLIYVLAAAWMCGFSKVLATTVASFKTEPAGLLVFFLGAWLVVRLPFNDIVEFFFWKRGLYESFSPMMIEPGTTPTEHDASWIPVPRNEWASFVKGHFFYIIPLFSLLWFFVFAFIVRLYCVGG